MHHPNNFYGQDETTLKDTKKEWLVTLVHGRYKANKEKNRGKEEKGSSKNPQPTEESKKTTSHLQNP